MAEEIRAKLKEELKDLPSNWIALIITSSDQYVKVNTELLKLLMEEGLKGIYVTINKPYSSIIEFLKKNEVEVDRLYFVDCVTKMVKGGTERGERCIFTHPSNLTAISIAINELIQTVKGDKFLFIDSLSTLLIYNSLGTTEKFSHFITNKIRVYNLKGVLLSLEEEMKEKLKLAKFCDKVIKI